MQPPKDPFRPYSTAAEFTAPAEQAPPPEFLPPGREFRPLPPEQPPLPAEDPGRPDEHGSFYADPPEQDRQARRSSHGKLRKGLSKMFLGAAAVAVVVIPALDSSGIGSSGSSEPGWSEPGGSEPGWSEPGGSEPGWSEPGWNEPVNDADYSPFTADFRALYDLVSRDCLYEAGVAARELGQRMTAAGLPYAPLRFDGESVAAYHSITPDTRMMVDFVDSSMEFETDDLRFFYCHWDTENDFLHCSLLTPADGGYRKITFIENTFDGEFFYPPCEVTEGALSPEGNFVGYVRRAMYDANGIPDLPPGTSFTPQVLEELGTMGLFRYDLDETGSVRSLLNAPNTIRITEEELGADYLQTASDVHYVIPYGDGIRIESVNIKTSEWDPNMSGFTYYFSDMNDLDMPLFTNFSLNHYFIAPR
ncbi:MAG: hypothetical protein PUB51_03155 [Oscillospiraceae bacterium]|nr:hypothetical protein [Oscillospiraceae bacterium]